jgi:hypothetical protein
MATFHGQTVDIYEDFEDSTLATGLTESDTNNILTINSSGRYYVGSYSCAIDLTSGNNNPARIGYTLASAGSISFGFWYYTAPYSSNGKENSMFMITSGGVGHKAFQIWDDQTWGGTRNLSFTEMGAGTTVSSSTWYWITGKWEAGVGATLRVYDTSHSQVGSDITTTGSGGDYHADNADDIRIGFSGDEWSNYSDTINFDDYVIDETNMLWPILGWDTGGTTSVVPQIWKHMIRMMRN